MPSIFRITSSISAVNKKADLRTDAASRINVHEPKVPKLHCIRCGFLAGRTTSVFGECPSIAGAVREENEMRAGIATARMDASSLLGRAGGTLALARLDVPWVWSTRVTITGNGTTKAAATG